MPAIRLIESVAVSAETVAWPDTVNSDHAFWLTSPPPAPPDPNDPQAPDEYPSNQFKEVL